MPFLVKPKPERAIYQKSSRTYKTLFGEQYSIGRIFETFTSFRLPSYNDELLPGVGGSNNGLFSYFIVVLWGLLLPPALPSTTTDRVVRGCLTLPLG